MSSVYDKNFLAVLRECSELPSPPINFDSDLASQFNSDLLGQFATLACLSGNEAIEYAQTRMRVCDKVGLVERRHNYAFLCHSLVTRDLIMGLWSFMRGKKVLSVASGNAFLESILYELGIDLFSSDINKGKCEKTRKIVASTIVTHLKRIHPDVRKRIFCDILPFYEADATEIIRILSKKIDVFFMSWLEPGPMSDDVLDAVIESVTEETESPKYIILLGEHNDKGSCGSSLFNEKLCAYLKSGKLKKLAEITKDNNMLCFHQFNDSCTVYEIEQGTSKHNIVEHEGFVEFFSAINQPTMDEFLKCMLINSITWNDLSYTERKLVHSLCLSKSEVQTLIEETHCLTENASCDQSREEISQIASNFDLVCFLFWYLREKTTLILYSNQFGIFNRLLNLLGCKVFSTDITRPDQNRTKSNILTSFAFAFKKANPGLGVIKCEPQNFRVCNAEESMNNSEEICGSLPDVIVISSAPPENDVDAIIAYLCQRANMSDKPISIIVLCDNSECGDNKSLRFREILQTYVQMGQITNLRHVSTNGFRDGHCSCDVYDIHP